MNQKIYILTNFSGYLKSYSPIIVVSEQVKMLKRAGYLPVLLVSEGWEPPEDSPFFGVETHFMYPAHVYNEPQQLEQNDLDEIEILHGQLKDILPDNAVVITHDLIFLPDYVKHNLACRQLAEERPGISWIHWIHSATSPNLLIQERAMYGEKYTELISSAFPNSIVAFPNAYSIPRVAKNFGYEQDSIFEVPHSTDPTDGMSPIVQRLVDAKGLLDNDVLMIYPLRLDRGKNAEINVRVIAACKRDGQKAHLVFCDFQSTGDDKLVYREELRQLARELNAEDCVTFLSEFENSAQMEVPHQVVMDLFTLSNVFLMPSKSETYSLVTQEAMLRGNFIILNQDFAPFRQIYGTDNAIYRPFSANIGLDGLDGEVNTTYPDGIDSYCDTIAINIRYWLKNDKVLAAKTWARRDRNPDAVFRNYLEPLLYRRASDVQ